MTATGRVLTPVEEDFPTICEWVRHGCVRADDLRDELLKALTYITDEGNTSTGSQP